MFNQNQKQLSLNQNPQTNKGYVSQKPKNLNYRNSPNGLSTTENKTTKYYSPNPNKPYIKEVKNDQPQIIVTPLSYEEKAKILSYALEMKYLTIQHIQKLMPPQKDAMCEVRYLVTNGYLKTKDEILLPATLVIPTSKAHDLIKTKTPSYNIEAVRNVFSPRVNHDLKLVDIRQRFESLNFIKTWYSERQLEKYQFLKEVLIDIPDACCKKHDERGYFLELEISPKTKARYQERIESYRKVLEMKEVKDQGIDGVIFIATDDKVVETVRSLLPENDKRFSVFPESRYMKERTKGVSQKPFNSQPKERASSRMGTAWTSK